ncbi:hypothetical protein [Treponema socranskii]|uniref:hypothetical protein n=1 Tax=Treponema socranskii TaxID=53419 RepID=UPI002871AE6D|nr:hypothetical protein [Treponema socranskii]MDR9860351.1 hypothetical protein [Treponema socranskii]
MTKTALQKKLFAMRDTVYRRFQQKLLPTLPGETIIGIRTPALRSFAKEFAKTPDAKNLLKIFRTFIMKKTTYTRSSSKRSPISIIGVCPMRSVTFVAIFSVTAVASIS